MQKESMQPKYFSLHESSTRPLVDAAALIFAPPVLMTLFVAAARALFAPPAGAAPVPELVPPPRVPVRVLAAGAAVAVPDEAVAGAEFTTEPIAAARPLCTEPPDAGAEGSAAARALFAPPPDAGARPPRGGGAQEAAGTSANSVISNANFAFIIDPRPLNFINMLSYFHFEKKHFL
jgi:hypothetical protein